MANLVFSMNATLPVFFVMVLGYLFRLSGVIDEPFAKKMNTFVFNIALPVNLFYQLSGVDVRHTWDTGYIVFCFVATLISIGLAVAIAVLVVHKDDRAEFVQGSYRSSASILGMAYIENIYGSVTMGPLMMLGCVPLYNVMAVLVLSLMGEGRELDKARLKASAKGILKNPIIWGIILGFGWALTGIKLPVMAGTTLNYIGRTASPLGLLAMGAMMDLTALGRRMGPVLGASFLKLVGFAAIFIPIGIRLGFRDEKLVAVLIMLGSASTVAGYIMARNMGHKGTVSSGCVALTTLLSAFTLTAWIYILRTIGVM